MIANATIATFRQMPVTWCLMLTILLSSAISLLNKNYFLRLLLHPVSVLRQKQVYRLFTSDFVHNDPVHLAMNEVMLFFVCGDLERYLRVQSPLGSLKYGVIYLVSLLAGSLAVTLLNREDFEYLSAGASGSVLGCMFSYTILQPQVIAFYLPVIGGVRNEFDALIFIGGLIYYKIRSKNTMINHELHFFGALGGIVTTLIMFSRLIRL